MNVRRWTWPVALGAVALVVAGLVWNSTHRPLTVETARVREEALVAEWSAVGYVESRTVNVASPAVGRIVSILVEEGDAVRPGQLLATIASRSEEAGLADKLGGVRAAEAKSASSEALLRENRLLQRDRERRAEADFTLAQEKLREATLSADRVALTGTAALESAKAEAEAAAATVQDLERGSLPEEIARAQADLKSAETVLAFARTEANRMAVLEKEGAAAHRDLESAQETLGRAEAARDARAAELAQLKRGSREDVLRSARARQRAAEARVRTAQADLAAGDIEVRRREQARAAVRSARAALSEVRAAWLHLQSMTEDVTAARAQTDQSRAGVRQAAAILADRRITAPFAGIVGRRLLDPGALASPGQPILTIVEPSRTWIAAEVDEQDVAPVRQGQAVAITVPAFAGRELEGTVERVGGEAVPQTEIRTGARIVRVRVKVAKRDSSLLRPGMEVHVSGKTKLTGGSILAPPDAIVADARGSFAWVVEGGRARRKAVRSGLLTGAGMEIVNGLRAGDEVVVGGKDELTEGSAVIGKARGGN
jgi:membrane fusion protein (multidrug efflux system)